MLYVLKANPVELNQEKLNQILEAADFNQLVGFAETSEFECKGAPYQLDKESQKRELAKDISSFANAKGGKIIIGLKTKPSTTHFGDEIEEVRGFAQGLVDTAQYRDVVNSWVYPRIEGLEVTWVATSEDRSKGVVVIAIPPQKDTVKPFLISKTLDDEKRVEIVFGYAERKGDESEPFSIVDLQTALRAGFNYENTLKDRLDGLEDLIREGGEHIVTQTMKEEQQKNLDKRVEFALSHGDFLKKKVVVMTASSQPRGELKTIFSNTEDSIKKKLENPPRLRWAGWDLTHLDQPKIIRGELIRVTNGDAKVIDLYRDGTMVFVALADRDFLAWASKDDFERINSLALPEAIYAFLRFYELVLGDFYNKPENVDVRVALNNLHLDGVKTMLMPYSLESLAQHFNGREAPEPNGLFELRVPSAAFRPEAVTYQLVREIYLWFGLGEEKIPYHKQDGGVEVFDTEPLTKKN